MLIVTLREDQKVLIGENISITVLKIRGGYVRVKIKAPDDISILGDKVMKNEQAN